MKKDAYSLLTKQLKELINADPYYLPVLANASALLWEALDEINWAGFYIVKGGLLVLGPFQGKPACIHIQKGHGVCGTAWDADTVKRVADIHAFPGHIACDSASRSEIVIPIHAGGRVVAVMDIDSPVKERFDEADQKGLELLVRVMEDTVVWEP